MAASAQAPSTARLPALDAARVFALLAGIVFHGMESLTFAKTYSIVEDT